MRKINYIIKTIAACLFAVLSVGANLSMVASAAEVESTPVAIIEIQDYNIEGGMIEIGKEITVNLTLHNASVTTNASSVMVTFSNSLGCVYPTYGNDNQVYVGTIAADDTKNISIPLTIGDGFTGTAFDLTCQFDYVTAGTRATNSSTIVIPTSGGSTIGVKSIDVSTHAVVNGKSLLSLSYVNQSNANITDAKLVIDGNVSSTSKEIKLDTVYAGKTYTNDFYVIFTEKGNQQVKLWLQYTDADGSEKVNDLGTFDVSVSAESSNEDTGNSLSGVFGIVGKAVAGIASIIVLVTVGLYVKKK